MLSGYSNNKMRSFVFYAGYEGPVAILQKKYTIGVSPHIDSTDLIIKKIDEKHILLLVYSNKL